MQPMPPGTPPSPYQLVAIAREGRFCLACGGIGEPKLLKHGSTLVELILWFTCVGGLIYSLWRRSNKIESCPYCGQPGMVLPDSAAAQAARRG